MASRLPWQAKAAIIKFFEINYYGWLVGGKPATTTNRKWCGSAN